MSSSTPGPVGRPSAADYQPRLRLWSHVWRMLLTLAISGIVWLTVREQMSATDTVVDLALGVPAVVLVLWRRRAPFTVAVVVTLLSTLSALASGPATLAAVSLATGRRWAQIAAIAVLSVVTAEVFAAMRPAERTEPSWVTLASNIVIISAAMAWGMYIGSRRELLWTLRARAERAEAEQAAHVERSRLAERSRIAREMHDVLAHRISQISMRAGALSYREDLRTEQVRDEVAVIRDTAHQALTDLRDVLGVLRHPEVAGDRATSSDRPQPTYGDLEDLVEEARREGQRIDFMAHLEPAAGTCVPEAAGRAVYRIVQEGLTNARKHAPGARIDVSVTGSPDDGIAVRLRNPVGFASSGTPGAGLGLLGLVERAELRGGRLDHGRRGADFVVDGWIPWAA